MRAGAMRSLGELFRSLVIDAIVLVFIGKSMGYPSKVDYGIAILQKGLPVERCGQIWQSGEDYIRVIKSGRLS